MRKFRHLSFRVFASLFFLFAAVAAFADDDDPPSRVARLKYITGDVSVQPGGVDDWVLANINRPLTTADRVWTEKEARAELHLGTSVMRMNSETSLALTNLTDDTVQVAVYQGTLNLRIKQLFRGEIYEVDTPNVAFTITKSGEYRFDVDSNNDTTFVTVRKGEGVATGDGPAVKVKKDQYARFSGAKSLDHSVGRAPGRDGFDEWCKVRDSRESYAVAGRYVSPYVIGYEDLDGYGYWQTAVGYGPVWYPRVVAVGWAPYRYGHWVWVHPWGWTWVDDAPWGFAPFHYGRWVNYSGRWGWCPGPIRYRPYYAPALVAWVGGSNWGIGIGFGGGPRVGWFPLGFGEPYIPHYRVSRRYFQNVNVSNTRITNVTNITNIYNNVYNDNRVINSNNRNINIDNSRNNIHINNHNNIHIKYANLKVHDAVTGVPSDAMVHGRPVQQASLKLDAKDLNERDVMYRSQVKPSRESVLGGRAERVAPRPQGVAEKQVREKLAPPQRASVDARRQALERDMGRPMDRGASERGPANDRQATDNNRVPRPSRGMGQGQNNQSAADSQTDRGKPQRGPAPAERINNGRGNSEASNSQADAGKPQRGPLPAERINNGRSNNDAPSAADGRRELPASVPRPPRRGRDNGEGTPLEAQNQEQNVPRPEMGNGNNGRDARDDRGIPGDSGKQREVEKRPVPRPMPAERGPAVSSPRSTPAERTQSQSVPSPRNNDNRVAPGHSQVPRPDTRVERVPRSQSAPQPRSESSMPSRSESPRMESQVPRSQPRVESSAPSRSESPRMESQAPRSQPRVESSAPNRSESPRVETQAPRSHGDGGGGASRSTPRENRGSDKGGKDKPDKH